MPKLINDYGYQAFRILQIAFIAPILAGLDKFFNLLTNWSQYLSPLALPSCAVKLRPSGRRYKAQNFQNAF